MALFDRLNLKAKSLLNTGFGTSASSYGGRFINKDGSANAVKKGIGYVFLEISFNSFIVLYYD